MNYRTHRLVVWFLKVYLKADTAIDLFSFLVKQIEYVWSTIIHIQLTFDELPFKEYFKLIQTPMPDSEGAGQPKKHENRHGVFE